MLQNDARMRIPKRATTSAIARAVDLMNGFTAPWGIAGGWALDLFIGHESRPHADIDIAIMRTDQQQLRSRLSGRVEKVVAGELAEWSSAEMLEGPVHEIHVTWPDGYQLEFLLNEQDQATHEWVFRRDGRIRRTLAAAFATNRDVPYLVPEIVLLYKAKGATEKDDADLSAALPHLSSEQRTWLGEALAVTTPGHRWLSVLAREAERTQTRTAKLFGSDSKVSSRDR
jgi:Aminoglycoside-2''-adenylyltransferase